MKIITKTYTFDGTPYPLRIFGDKAAFCTHLKHFRDSNQPWDTIASLHGLQAHCQKISDRDVFIVYKRIAQ